MKPEYMGKSSPYLPGNPKLVWNPARLIQKGGCVDLSLDTMRLKYSSVLFGSESSYSLLLPTKDMSLATFHMPRVALYMEQ